MPHVKEITFYEFDELSQKAKDKAIDDNLYINVDYDWWDFIYGDAATVGIKLTGFSLDRSQEITGALQWNVKDICEKIMTEHGESCETYITAKEYLTKLTAVLVTEQLTDSEGSDEFYELIDSFTKDILRCYWKILYSEYEYLMSDEAIAETLISNDYEFNQDETRV